MSLLPLHLLSPLLFSPAGSCCTPIRRIRELHMYRERQSIAAEKDGSDKKAVVVGLVVVSVPMVIVTMMSRRRGRGRGRRNQSPRMVPIRFLGVGVS